MSKRRSPLSHFKQEGLTKIKSDAHFDKHFENLLAWIEQDSSNRTFPFEGGNETRKAKSENSIAEFGRIYLPHYLRKASAPFHASWEKTARICGQPMLIEAFREAGKSTFFSFLDVLHAICFERAKFVLLGAYTVERAEMFSSRILAELLANQRLSTDFGDLIEGAGSAQGLFKAGGTTVQAISIGQNVRGLVAGPYRPDFVRLDDIQGRKSAHNRKIVEEQVRWIVMDLIPALEEGYNLKIVATQVAPRDVVQLLREGGSERTSIKNLRTPLLDKEGRSVWPEQYSGKRIASLQKTLGRRAFNQEYLLQVASDDEGKLQVDWFRYYEPSDIRGKQYRFVLSASDLGSYKTSSRHDYKATVILGINHGTEIDVLAARLKRETPNQFIKSLYELAAIWEPQTMYWEDNGQQSIMQDLFLIEAEKRGHYLPLKPLTNNQNKESRIEGTLFPLIENCRIFFHPQDAMQKLLIEQLLDFPDGAHDDGPDALEMAVRMGLRLLKSGRGTLPRTIIKRQSSALLRHY
ncbi:MAG: hypothetical protein AAF975_00560 [Spirochaetota bacterium]